MCTVNSQSCLRIFAVALANHSTLLRCKRLHEPPRTHYQCCFLLFSLPTLGLLLTHGYFMLFQSTRLSMVPQQCCALTRQPAISPCSPIPHFTLVCFTGVYRFQPLHCYFFRFSRHYLIGCSCLNYTIQYTIEKLFHFAGCLICVYFITRTST